VIDVRPERHITRWPVGRFGWSLGACREVVAASDNAEQSGDEATAPGALQALDHCGKGNGVIGAVMAADRNTPPPGGRRTSARIRGPRPGRVRNASPTHNQFAGFSSRLMCSLASRPHRSHPDRISVILRHSLRSGSRAGLGVFAKRIRKAAGVCHQPPEGGEHAVGAGNTHRQSKGRDYHPDSSPRVHPRSRRST
jgi:hypothetical protein